MSEFDMLDSWWEDDFPFNVDDEEQMSKIHQVLPQGYFLVVDLSSGYDAPDESDRYIMLLSDKE